MKLRSLLVSFAILLSYSSTFARDIHEWQVADTNLYQLFSANARNLIDFRDSSNFSIIGIDQLDHFLLKSIDKGSSWQKIYREPSHPGTEWNCLAYPSVGNYFIGGDSILYIGSNQIMKGFLKIYNEDNNSCRIIDFDTNTMATNIKMINQSYGGLILQTFTKTHNDSLIVTTDGWSTRKAYPLPEEIMNTKDLFCFGEGKFLINSYDAPSKCNRIYLTSDGGQTWERHDTVPYGTQRVFFLNENLGWAAGLKSALFQKTRDLLYKTTDGGKTWVNKLDTVFGRGAELINLSFSDENYGIAIGNGGKVISTTDGGDSWALEKINDNEWEDETLFHVAYPSHNVSVILSSLKIFSFTGKMFLPAPVIIEPANDNRGEQSTHVNLKWTKVEGADQYQLQVVRGKRLEIVEKNYEYNLFINITQEDTTYQLSKLNWSSQYTFRVRAITKGDSGCWSYATTFSTLKDESQLPSPKRVSPDIGESVDPNSITLVWENVEGAYLYDFQLSSAKYFMGSLILKEIQDIKDTTLTLTGLIQDTAYYWRVRAKSTVSTSEWSSVNRGYWAFITNKTTGLVNDFNPYVMDCLVYPNPASNFITFNYNIDELSRVRLSIYNSLGKETGAYINTAQEQGKYMFTLGTSNLPEGIYFYRLQAGKKIETGKFCISRE